MPPTEEAAAPPQPTAAPPLAIKMDPSEENLDNLGPDELELLTDNLEDMCKVSIGKLSTVSSYMWPGNTTTVHIIYCRYQNCCSYEGL